MNKTYYFISGMPRSGSTLLANVLSQNPRFHSTQTSGCLDVLFGIRNSWDRLIEHKACPNPNALKRVLRASLEAYYGDIERPVIIDKSRGWLAHLELLETILDQPIKVLSPVRPIYNILASFEKLYRETAKTKQPPDERENYFTFQSIEGRCEHWMNQKGVVGLAFNRINDAIKRGYKKNIHFVDFNDLTNDPSKKMSEIYEFLNEPLFDHDFDHIEQVTQEDDAIHGFVNLHKIKPRIQPLKNDAVEILGLELVKKYN